MITAKHIQEVARRHREAARPVDGWELAGKHVDERFRCTAFNKRTGERCKNPRVTDTDVCRKHGGAAFWTQHRYLSRRLEEAVTAHLEWCARHRK